MVHGNGLIHEIIPVGMLHCNCHIVGDPTTHEGVVIDPGDDADRILELIRHHALAIRAIVVTHTHIDHVGALERLHAVTGAPVRMHPDDIELYRMLDVQAAWLGCKAPEKAEVDEVLREGDTIRWGNYEAQVLHTPGHTQGSICLYVRADAHWTGSTPEPAQIDVGQVKADEPQPGRLFSGDTLFAGSIGRTDLWGGSLRTIMASLSDKVLQLPDDTLVYPGHGETTTIGQERDTNPFLAQIK